jgi:predicted RNA-binding Zn-ribbon protein involved in translation (DUF1610 family)
VSEEKFIRRRRVHRESRGRQLLGDFKFELIWLLVVAVGLFLLFERFSLRATLTLWAREVAHNALQRTADLDDQIGTFLTQVSISDLVGLVLILCATGAILLRIRWRLLNAPGLTQIQCPRCGGGIHRIHRTWTDRLVGLFVPVRRYRCRNDECGWKGLRVGRSHGISASKSAHSTSEG